jgi:hypothetical protein
VGWPAAVLALPFLERSAMRIAVLYDIHGNALSLEAVLEEAGRLQVALIVGGRHACPG